MVDEPETEITPACAPGVAEPVAQWAGEQDCADARGNNPGQCTEAVGFAAGAVGQGFDLSGSGSSYVVVPDSPQLKAAAAISIDAWINPAERRGRIVDKITANTSDGYLLDFLDDGKLRVLVRTNVLTLNELVPVNRFTHVAAIYDGASVRLYLNGVQAAVKSTTAMPTHKNAVPLHLGADSAGVNTFKGVLDEVRIFDRALSAREVQALYQQGSAAHCGCAPLAVRPVGWWPGDGDTEDVAGTSAARIEGSVSYATGAANDGFSFIGKTQSYVEVPHKPALQLQRALTLEAWVSPHVSSGRIVDKIPANTTSGFLLDYVNAHVRFLVGADAATSTETARVDAFHHIAGVYDGARVTLYVDGERAAAVAASSMSVPSNTLPMRIGADSDGLNNFDGIIDEIRIYDRALSASEVRDIYFAGAAKRCL